MRQFFLPYLLQLALFTAVPKNILYLSPLFNFCLSSILVPYFQLASIPPDPNIKQSGDGEAGGGGAAHEVSHPVRVVEQAMSLLLVALLSPDQAGAVQHRAVDDWRGEEGEERKQ